MAVGDTLTVAAVVPEAVAVGIGGAFDRLRTQPQADGADPRRRTLHQLTGKVIGKSLGVDLLPWQQGQSLARRANLHGVGQ